MPEYLPWVLFNVMILVLLGLDLGLFHRRERALGVKEALLWTAFWVGLALLFNLFVYFWRGAGPAQDFLAGYLIEKSLSVDNLFVFLTIFSFFKIPPLNQHKVLFWGIVGALVMRGLFIAGGISLIHRFDWIVYVFGAFLVFTGVKLLFQGDEEIHPEHNPVVRIFRRFVPFAGGYEGSKFFVRESGRRLATRLFLVVLLIESSDVLFAVDSIPAVLSISKDAFIVYSSNVFAILGLRSLYFALAGAMSLFHYLNYGLSAILVFVGVKMLAAEYYPISTPVALGVIAGVLIVSVVASILNPPAEAPALKE